MLPFLPALLLLVSAAALAQPPAGEAPGAAPRDGLRGPGPQGPRGGLFLSPMGEPFRSADPAADNVGTWFAQADADHDGALTLAEMQADAARFYATLDVNHDGEIDPEELARYENEVAPEVQVGMQMHERGFGRGGGGWGGGGGGGWSGGGHRGGHDRGEGGAGAGGEREGRSAPNGGFDEGLEGAGRFSFINIPEPVISADADLNRGVSRAEFLAAAGRRFVTLDVNHDGRLTRDELPPLPVRHPGKQKKRKGGPIRREGEPLTL